MVLVKYSVMPRHSLTLTATIIPDLAAQPLVSRSSLDPRAAGHVPMSPTISGDAFQGCKDASRSSRPTLTPSPTHMSSQTSLPTATSPATFSAVSLHTGLTQRGKIGLGVGLGLGILLVLALGL